MVPARAEAVAYTYLRALADVESDRGPVVWLVDLFCGCGGFSSGARAAGMKPLLGVDAEQLKVDVYNNNFGAGTAVNHWLGPEHDAWLYDEIISRFMTRQQTDLDTIHIHGSPPCRRASKARGRAWKSGNVSESMMEWFLNFVTTVRSAGIDKCTTWSFEDTHNKNLEKDVLIDGFGLVEITDKTPQPREDIPFFCIIDCAWYGVPQSRERLIGGAGWRCPFSKTVAWTVVSTTDLATALDALDDDDFPVEDLKTLELDYPKYPLNMRNALYWTTSSSRYNDERLMMWGHHDIDWNRFRLPNGGVWINGVVIHSKKLGNQWTGMWRPDSGGRRKKLPGEIERDGVAGTRKPTKSKEVWKKDTGSNWQPLEASRLRQLDQPSFALTVKYPSIWVRYIGDVKSKLPVEVVTEEGKRVWANVQRVDNHWEISDTELKILSTFPQTFNLSNLTPGTYERVRPPPASSSIGLYYEPYEMYNMCVGDCVPPLIAMRMSKAITRRKTAMYGPTDAVVRWASVIDDALNRVPEQDRNTFEARVYFFVLQKMSVGDDVASFVKDNTESLLDAFYHHLVYESKTVATAKGYKQAVARQLQKKRDVSGVLIPPLNLPETWFRDEKWAKEVEDHRKTSNAMGFFAEWRFHNAGLGSFSAWQRGCACVALTSRGIIDLATYKAWLLLHHPDHGGDGVDVDVVMAAARRVKPLWEEERGRSGSRISAAACFVPATQSEDDIDTSQRMGRLRIVF